MDAGARQQPTKGHLKHAATGPWSDKQRAFCHETAQTGLAGSGFGAMGMGMGMGWGTAIPVAQDRRERYCTIGEADAERWLVNYHMEQGGIVLTLMLTLMR